MKLSCYHSNKLQPNISLLPSSSSSSSFSSTIRGRRRRCWVRMDSSVHQKSKIIVIMGATGTGKSRLSIDLATRFFPAEIINSDKMQVYRGLDITTNKIPLEDRLGIPHHLLGEFDSDIGELSPSDYRSIGSATIQDIQHRGRLPVIVGGSNSYVYSLLSDEFDPDSDSDTDVFNGFGSISKELRYNCCFLWVDVAMPVLYEYLLRRVDDMFDAGMLDELADFFESEAESDSVKRADRVGVGIRKAIGVPEFSKYFCGGGGGGDSDILTTMDTRIKMDVSRQALFEEAVDAIKYNTCRLAKRQVEKILQLRSAGWNLQRLDATDVVFRSVLASRRDISSKIWKEQMLEPSMKIVKRFLEQQY